jgi:N-acetylneuraminic acid mutarotase
MNTQNVFKVVVWIGLISLASLSLAAEGVWTKKADMPTARSLLASCVVDGKVYAIGGGRPSAVLYSAVEQYDPATDTWTKKANMPTPRTTFGLSVVNGKIYAIGGGASGGALVSIVEEYDPVADTWTTRAPMPTARAFLSCAVAAGKIYAIGGLRSGSSACSPVVEEYDPVTDTWTRKANTPKPRGAASCSTVGGIIYLVGGMPTGGQGTDRAQPTVQAYDPATDTWTTKAPMTTARGFLSTCVMEGKIYAIGGCLNAYDSSDLSSMEAYDPATDTWWMMPSMQVKRKGLGSAVVSGRIYAIGGVSHGGWDPALATVEEYDPNPLVVDFNGDGIVDIKDLLRLIESWGQDDPLVDIAPPFGDGVIDALDLKVLMSHWQEEVIDPTLVACWKLDEAEGIVAHDSAGYNDGTVVDLPVWLPDGGKVGGALEFDGITSIVTDFVLDPSDGPFRAFTWVQGGMPGQTILSQANGRNWLSTDQGTGALTTELTIGLIIKPLVSQAVITDGDWYRVGVSWDGTNLVLYVDDVEVARKMQSSIPSSQNGLYIGAGCRLGVDTFFSGLIDDVRIYNRAVSP